MPYCPECGVEFYPGDDYCTECGAELPDHEPTRRQPRQPRRQQPTHSQKRGRLGQGIGLISALLAGGGVFLPWLQVSAFGASATLTGMDYEMGVLILIIALVAGVLYIPEPKIAQGVAGILGTVVILLTLVYINDPVGAQSDTPEIAQRLTQEIAEVGFGAYLSLLGGVGMTTGTLISLFWD